MRSKHLLVGILSSCLVLSMSFTSLAGQWQQDHAGWWYQEDDGSYPAGQWKELNGKWYCFNQYGYMVSNAWRGNYYLGPDGAMLTNTTTPDGYRVGPDGAWIQDSRINELYNEKKLELEKMIQDSDYGVTFKLEDFNNDGIDELLAIIDRVGHHEVKMWTYIDDGLMEIGVPENPYKYASIDNNVLCYAHVGYASHAYYAYYRLTSNLTFEFIMDISWENGAYNDEGYDTYYINDINGNHIRMINEAEFDELKEKY